MSNLVKTGQLKEHTASAEEISRLIAAAERNLTDAQVTGVSDGTRFDAAYKCIMQSASAALLASGYRASTNVPGHHQTVIATLRLTVGVPADQIRLLDALRRQRNVNDYTGDVIDSNAVRECVTAADALLEQIRQWLEKSLGGKGR
ncbi:MAG: hypothetical protein WBO04_15145 [Steroidobacteraceae bacterium]